MTLASTALADPAPQEPVRPKTDAAQCSTIEGFQAFTAQWMIDVNGALTSGALTADVANYILAREDALSKALPVKPTPGDMIQFCEDLNALFAR